MYQTTNQIIDINFDGLQLKKLFASDQKEVLLISLEKGTLFPEHVSPRDAVLIVLTGEINFHINDENFQIKEDQTFTFPAEVTHWVAANENSKFLIVR